MEKYSVINNIGAKGVNIQVLENVFPKHLKKVELSPYIYREACTPYVEQVLPIEKKITQIHVI